MLLGQSDGVIHFGPRSNPRKTKYWAERGLIHIEDTEDAGYESVSIEEFLYRLKSVNDMLGNSRSDLTSGGFAHADEVQRQQRFVAQAIELVKKAQIQGSPFDPEAIKGKVQRRPVSVVVPGNYSF